MFVLSNKRCSWDGSVYIVGFWIETLIFQFIYGLSLAWLCERVCDRGLIVSLVIKQAFRTSWSYNILAIFILYINAVECLYSKQNSVVKCWIFFFNSIQLWTLSIEMLNRRLHNTFIKVLWRSRKRVFVAIEQAHIKIDIVMLSCYSYVNE